jgi:hypothetical protein
MCLLCFLCFFLFDRLSTNLLAAAFAGQSLLNPFLLARLQVKGVFLDFFDDVFLLNFALEPSQRIFDRLAILNSNLSQSITPPIRLQ